MWFTFILALLSVDCLIYYTDAKGKNLRIPHAISSACFLVPSFPNISRDSCSCWWNSIGYQVCMDDLLNHTLNEQRAMTIRDIHGVEKADRNALMYTILHGDCSQVTTKNGVLNMTTIRTCPAEYNLNPDIKQSCEHADNNDLPPIDISFVTFQNIYCALCHGLDESQATKIVTPWSIEISCLNDIKYKWDDLEEAVYSGNCQKYFIQKGGSHHQCGMDLKHILDIDCCLCLEKLGKTTMDCLLCRMVGRIVEENNTCSEEEEQKMVANDILPTLKNLFSIPKDEQVQISINGGLFKVSDICKDNENFDILFQKCRDFVCGFGQYALKGECHDNKTIYLKAQSQPLPRGLRYLMIRIPTHFWWEMSEDIKSVDILEIGQDRGATILELDINHQGFEIILDVLSGYRVSVKRKFSFPITITNLNQNSTFNTPCSQGSFCCINKSESYFFKGTMYAKVVDIAINQTILYPINNILFDMSVYPTSEEFTFNQICVCKPSGGTNLLNCTLKLRKYKADEYVVDKDGVLKVLGYNLEFKEYEYYTENGEAFVCYDSSDIKAFLKFDHIQEIVSWFCSGLSIICLFITVIFYCIFEHLRTLPGRLTMGVSVSLMCGQSLLLVTVSNKTVCRYIAALTHYSWLSSFIWMSSQAVNMLLTFRHKVTLSKKGNVFKRYLLVAMFLPLFIVGTCLVMDIIPGSPFQVKYGVLTCSWMTNINGYIYAFFVPVGLSLVINMVCFAVTLYSIEKTMTMAEAVAGKMRDRKRCFMYVKLSSVMGFTWVFGFIASALNVKVLWYLFIILNGLQGVFIFLSFGFSARTRQHLAGRMSTTRFSNLFSTETMDHSKSARVTT